MSHSLICSCELLTTAALSIIQILDLVRFFPPLRRFAGKIAVLDCFCFVFFSEKFRFLSVIFILFLKHDSYFLAQEIRRAATELGNYRKISVFQIYKGGGRNRDSSLARSFASDKLAS